MRSADRVGMVRSGFGDRFPARDSAAVKALASNIRKLRKARGWTQDDLAAAVQIEQAAASLLENGRANPTLLVLEGLARVMEVRLSDLFESHGRVRRGKDR